MRVGRQHTSEAGAEGARRVRLASTVAAGLVTLAGCGGLAENETLPPGVLDPAQTQTPEGALAAYRGVHYDFKVAFAGSKGFVVAGALLSDELGNGQYGQPVFGQPATLDRRYLPEGEHNEVLPYEHLHRVRAQASEAIGLLATYAPDLSPALRAGAYALAGYAEVLLADLYCSGIPLSTVEFGGDYTLRPGSSTDEVYQHALALFDTALTLASDSARLLHVAQVGKGRALLAMGRYAEAGQAVAAVPDSFRYAIDNSDFIPLNFSSQPRTTNGDIATLTDREGLNGLPYVSSGRSAANPAQPAGDPRVAWVSATSHVNKWGFRVWRPAKYDENGATPIVLASGIEARLTEAEAALAAGDTTTWLDKLNHLRRTAWPTIVNSPADLSATGPLPDTTDPGTDTTRLDLMFRERAFWLFLTGHRQGDLRRLIRHYGREPESVYPSGLYPDGQGSYGTDVTVPVPPAERALNPHYTGCRSRGA